MPINNIYILDYMYVSKVTSAVYKLTIRILNRHAAADR